ncbi:hypothetical protein Anas_06548, partial [Armadillidium nasatum]
PRIFGNKLKLRSLRAWKRQDSKKTRPIPQLLQNKSFASSLQYACHEMVPRSGEGCSKMG